MVGPPQTGTSDQVSNHLKWNDGQNLSQILLNQSKSLLNPTLLTKTHKTLNECIFSVGFSAHAMVIGEGLTNHQLPAHFKTFLSSVEISSHAQIPLFQAKGQYTVAQEDKTLQN